MYKYTKIQGPRYQRNNIIARDQKSDLHSTSSQSSPKVNRMLITRSFPYNKSLQHRTITVLLIKILIFLFRPLSSVHLLQRSQRFQAIEFVNRQFPRQFPRSPQETPGTMTPFLCPKYNEKRVADYASETKKIAIIQQ